MAIILWIAFAAIILLQTFGSIPTRVLGDELYAILAPAIFVGAIIATVKGKKIRERKKQNPRRHVRQLMFLRLALRPQKFMRLLQHRKNWNNGSGSTIREC